MSNRNSSTQRRDCFQVAADLIVSLLGGISDNLKEFREVTLVHGIVSGQGQLEGNRFTHAWIEGISSAGIPVVVDQSNGQELVMPQALYYLIGQIQETETERYTSEEARSRLLDLRHYGPWDGEPKAHVDPKPEEVERHDIKKRNAA